MQNYKTRLGNDYRQLVDRIEKLTSFIGRPKSKETVGDEQFALLSEQKAAMEKYKEVLEKRLIGLGEDIETVLKYHDGALDREKILSKAVDDCLIEMYEKSQPSDSYVDLCTEYENGTLDDEKRVYDFHYLSQEEYEYIRNKYKDAYNIRERWTDDINIMLRDLKEGGLKDGYKEDENGCGHRIAIKTPPISEVIGEENAEKVFRAIEDIRDFYRFDREEVGFDWTVGLATASPSCSKENVIKAWKERGVDIEIEDRDPSTFWDIDEYGHVCEDDG